MKLCGLICLYTSYNLCEIHIIWFSRNDHVGYNTIISVAGPIIIINIFKNTLCCDYNDTLWSFRLYTIYDLCAIHIIWCSGNDSVGYNSIVFVAGPIIIINIYKKKL
jgi:hypothetical protein